MVTGNNCCGNYHKKWNKFDSKHCNNYLQGLWPVLQNGDLILSDGLNKKRSRTKEMFKGKPCNVLSFSTNHIHYHHFCQGTWSKYEYLPSPNKKHLYTQVYDWSLDSLTCGLTDILNYNLPTTTVVRWELWIFAILWIFAWTLQKNLNHKTNTIYELKKVKFYVCFFLHMLPTSQQQSSFQTVLTQHGTSERPYCTGLAQRVEWGPMQQVIHFEHCSSGD